MPWKHVFSCFFVALFVFFLKNYSVKGRFLDFFKFMSSTATVVLQISLKNELPLK